MSTWNEYYQDRVNNLDYDDYFCDKYRLFLDKLILAIKALSNNSEKPIILKEEGCGIGTVSKCISKYERLLLSSLGVIEEEDSIQEISKVIFSDISSDMLELCRLNNGTQYNGDYLAGVPSFYSKEDITMPKYYEPNTVVITHGVLEHFCGDEVALIMETYDNPNVIFQAHYVPTNKYKTPSFGDERLMSVDYWTNLVNPNYYIVDNEGKDLYMFKLNLKDK